jgi:hypothetical protein
LPNRIQPLNRVRNRRRSVKPWVERGILDLGWVAVAIPKVAKAGQKRRSSMKWVQGVPDEFIVEDLTPLTAIGLAPIPPNPTTDSDGTGAGRDPRWPGIFGTTDIGEVTANLCSGCNEMKSAVRRATAEISMTRSSSPRT